MMQWFSTSNGGEGFFCFVGFALLSSAFFLNSFLFSFLSFHPQKKKKGVAKYFLAIATYCIVIAFLLFLSGDNRNEFWAIALLVSILGFSFFVYHSFKERDVFLLILAFFVLIQFCTIMFWLPWSMHLVAGFAFVFYPFVVAKHSFVEGKSTEKKPLSPETSDFEYLFRSVVDKISFGISVFDKNGFLVWSNATMRKYYGLVDIDTEHRRYELFDLYKNNEGVVNKVFDCLETRKHLILDENILVDGKELLIRSEFEPLDDGEIMVVNVVQNKQGKAVGPNLISASSKNRRFAVVSNLTGTLANDFNNILTPIIGHCEMALESIDSKNSAYQDVTEVLVASKRARTLIGQLLNYFNDFEQKSTKINITDVLSDSLKLLTSSISSDIKVSVLRKVPVAYVYANIRHLNQIFANILTVVKNSIDHSKTESLVVEQSIIHVDEDDSFAKGVYVSVTFLQKCWSGAECAEVNGNKELKETADGLGFSVIAGILEEYGGEFLLNEMPGEGLLYQILLPSYVENDVDGTVSRSRNRKNTEHIFIVDDETQITTMLSQRLGRSGYRVTVSSDPLKAVELFKTIHNDVDLVITDQTMPEMSGVQLVKEIVAIKPVPILLMTGYSEVLGQRTIEELGVRGVIYKPFDFVEFERQIRDAIGTEKLDIEELRDNLF